MEVWLGRARHGLFGMLLPLAPVLAQTQDGAVQELLRQQARERVLRDQQESSPDVRLRPSQAPAPRQLPADESPCFRMSRIQLDGEDAQRFNWALSAADPKHDAATGRCLGTAGINVVMARVQNAIVARGFVTTRILAAPQDLNTGTLRLTVVPGRIRAIRFAAHTSLKATAWNAVPAKRGDLLNLRDIEQALENFKRVPTVEADIQIVPADGDDARPGESDLVITWRQRSPPVRFSATLDDSGSKATGKLQSGVTLSLDDLLMWNDLFYANVNHDVFNANSKGTKSYTAHYSVPYGYWTLSGTASVNDPYAPGECLGEPVLNELFAHWKDPDLSGMQESLQWLCDYYTHRTARKDGMEFDYDLLHTRFPAPVLAWFRLRESIGLSNPVIDHPLMRPHYARLPPPQPFYTDELLDGVIARLRREEVPDLGIAPAQVAPRDKPEEPKRGLLAWLFGK